MKQSRVKILLFVLISAIVIPLLAIALNRFNVFSPNASGAVPQMITISNLTDTTATISWTTETNSVLTNLQWGETTVLGNTETDFRDKRDKITKPRTTHYVQLSGLKANTSYYYRISSGTSTYPDVSSEASTFKTISTTSATQPAALTVYGDVSGQETDVVVTVYVPGALGYTSIIPLTSVLSSDGTWFVNIASARNSSGSFINPAADVPIVVLGIGSEGKGSVSNIASNKSPITLKFDTTVTQSTLDKVLLAPVTSSATPTTTVTATPTTTSSTRQDVPLRPIGATGTPTTTVTTEIPEESSISRAQLIASFASPSISNVTESSLSIMFVSSTTAIGTLNWGTSATSLTSNRIDDKDSAQATARYIHHYTLTGLTANKQYFFKPTSETTIRTFTTPISISAPSGQTIITGTISNGSGECLVRTQVQRNTVFSSVITTQPNSLNAWAINVMPIRTSALDTYMIPVATDIVLTNAFCIASNGEVSYQAASTTLQNAVTSGITLTLVKLQ